VPLILEALKKLNGGTMGHAKHGKTSRLLIELMLETGLRVSDAGTICSCQPDAI
jgi:hypothetical protein